MKNFTNIDLIIESWKEQIFITLIDLLKIKSIKDIAKEGAPFGMEIRNALDFMLNLCSNEGFNVKEFDGYYGYADYSFENESNNNKMLGIFGHIDVVPSGDGWDTNPFEPIIRDGKIFARGSMDDKGPVIAAFYAIKALKELKIPINSNIRFFFGCDEETSFSCISKYIENEALPDLTIVTDANYPVTYAEKGVLSFNISKSISKYQSEIFKINSFNGGEKENIVPGSCEVTMSVSAELLHQIFIEHDKFEFKERLEIRDSLESYSVKTSNISLKTKGIKAHASLSKEGLSAISIMINFLNKLNFSGEWKDFFSFYDSTLGINSNDSVFGFGISNPSIKDISLNLGLINFDGQILSLTTDIRYPHDVSSENFIEVIKNTCTEHNIEVSSLSNFPPMCCPKDSFIVKTLLEIYNAYYNTNEEPVSIGSSTYAHNLPQAVAFGPNHPRKTKLAHKSNEFIEIQNLLDSAKLYARAIVMLSNNVS